MKRSYSLRKIDQDNQEERSPYPGVIIEEMLDSASTHNENYPVALHTGEQQEPDVRILKNKYLLDEILIKI
jgi:hypothetical protein